MEQNNSMTIHEAFNILVNRGFNDHNLFNGSAWRKAVAIISDAYTNNLIEIKQEQLNGNKY